MPSEEASSSTTISDTQAWDSASRRPVNQPGRLAGITSQRSRCQREKFITLAASLRVSGTPVTACCVLMVIGTTVVLTITASLRPLSMPNSTINSGIQPSVGICARA